ncbi:MAG: hypothetical protein D8M59_03765 [Planctomycetes bacterium]|nr:hypothetical protein [Planctomycetota bacterium]NOG53113.1 hypothetical protein [Planctomycetota bacterium]
MKQTTTTIESIDVPDSALVRREQRNQYGSVPGLDDEELADPVELERQVYLNFFGPILQLPVRHNNGWIRPQYNEDGSIEFGAFGTVDFQRLVPAFDKARYKAQMLREELRDIVIRQSIVSERVPSRAKFLVLKYLRMGLLDLDHISDHDMWLMARLYLRARRIRGELEQLEQRIRQRRSVGSMNTE